MDLALKMTVKALICLPLASLGSIWGQLSVVVDVVAFVVVFVVFVVFVVLTCILIQLYSSTDLPRRLTQTPSADAFRAHCFL